MVQIAWLMIDNETWLTQCLCGNTQRGCTMYKSIYDWIFS